MKNDTAIIVAAKDSYSDTWEAFFGLLFKYWPDCPYPIYLFSEEETFDDPRVRALVVYNDSKKPWGEQWVERVREGIKRVDADYFILLHTDYFLHKKIDTARIEHMKKLLERGDIGYIRLVPAPPPTLKFPGDAGLGLLDKSLAYNVSLQAGFWKRGIFERFLTPGLHPREFEKEGSKNSHGLDEMFLCAKKSHDVLPYIHGISKDVWQYDAIKLLEREGYPVGERGLEGLGSYLFRKSGLKKLKYGLKRRLKR